MQFWDSPLMWWKWVTFSDIPKFTPQVTNDASPNKVPWVPFEDGTRPLVSQFRQTYRFEASKKGGLHLRKVLLQICRKDIISMSCCQALAQIVHIGVLVISSSLISTTHNLAPSQHVWRSFLLVGLLMIQSLLVHHHYRAAFIGGAKINALATTITYQAMLESDPNVHVSTAECLQASIFDGKKIQGLIDFVSNLWLAPLQIAISSCYVAMLLGWPSVFISLAVVVIGVRLESVLTRIARAADASQNEFACKRISLLTDIIVNMRTVKCYMLESFLEKKIRALRASELSHIESIRRVRSFMRSISSSVPLIAASAAILAQKFLYAGGELPPMTAILAVVTLMYDMKRPIEEIPAALNLLQIANKSCCRIENYLNCLEFGSVSSKAKSCGLVRNSLHESSWCISVSKRCATTPSGPKAEDVSQVFEGSSGDLVVIMGSNGCGKSSMVREILRAIWGCQECDSGVAVCVRSGARLGYCDEVPWLEATSIRDNITMGSPYEPEWMAEVLKACSLQEEIKAFPMGDLTLVTDHAANLSGGQKQRIALARAIYSKPDLVFLDDALCSLDRSVSIWVQREAVRQLLMSNLKACVVIVTHDLNIARSANQIVFMARGGSIERFTSFENLSLREDIMLVLEGKRDMGDELKEPEQIPRSRLRTTDEDSDDDYPTSPVSSAGFVGEQSSPGGSLTAAESPAVTAMKLVSLADKRIDGVIRTPMRRRGMSCADQGDCEKHRKCPKMAPDISPWLIRREYASALTWERAKEHRSSSVWKRLCNVLNSAIRLKKYISQLTLVRAAGGLFPLVISWLFHLIGHSIVLFSHSLMVKVHAGAERSFDQISEDSFLYALLGRPAGGVLAFLDSHIESAEFVIITSLIVGCAGVILSLCGSLLLSGACLRSAATMHEEFASRLIRAKPKFFETTELGEITSAYGVDLSNVDMKLAQTLLVVIWSFTSVVATLSGAVFLSPSLLVGVLLLAFAYMALQRDYIRNVTWLQRVEQVTRSPIETQLLATLDGRFTIKTFGATGFMMAKFVEKLDQNFSAFYYEVLSNRWLGVRIEGCCHLMIGMAALSLLSGVSRQEFALRCAFFTASLKIPAILSETMRMSGELGHRQRAFERFCAVSARAEPECPIELPKLPQCNAERARAIGIKRLRRSARNNVMPPKFAWGLSTMMGSFFPKTNAATEVHQLTRQRPLYSHGGASIQVRDWKVWYDKRIGRDGKSPQPPALHIKDLKIEPGSKVALVGRTGCGKSTFFASLLRLHEDDQVYGSLKIDGAEIRTMPRPLLRSMITVIPQDNLLFEGNLRENLDPLGERSDEEIKCVLEKLELNLAFSLKELSNVRVDRGGFNFSAGERQGISMARAILRRNRILLLDEATSHVDSVMQEKMHKILDQECAHRPTMIAIVHRVESLKYFDKVVVINTQSHFVNSIIQVIHFGSTR